MARRQPPPPKNKSYAARFREVFEKAVYEAEHPPKSVEQHRKLARGPEKQAVIKYLDSTPRYVYEDGTLDESSAVSPEVEDQALAIGAVVTTENVVVLPEPQTDPETAPSQAESVGHIATREAIAA